MQVHAPSNHYSVFPTLSGRWRARHVDVVPLRLESTVPGVGQVLVARPTTARYSCPIDFALEAARSEGKSPLDAIHQACLLRFHPIMMTTMCAIAAGLPLALGFGAGSELRRPLGIAIVGGLFVSQFLTLYTTPIIYLCLERLGRWSHRQTVKTPRSRVLHGS